MPEAMELLKQIAKNTGSYSTMTVLIALITAVSTLSAAAITAYMTYRYNKNKDEISKDIELKKLKAGIVTVERLRWLQELRDKASSFYANMDMQYNLLKRPSKLPQNQNYQTESDILSKEIMKQCNNIIFLLNPKREDQKKLRESTDGALAFFLQCVQQRNTGQLSFNDIKYTEIKGTFFDSLTSIGIETWGKIKELQ